MTLLRRYQIRIVTVIAIIAGAACAMDFLPAQIREVCL